MRRLVKVRCDDCGYVSWWAKESPYICRACGCKRGRILSLIREALARKEV